jgi:hypothetical protein
MNKTPKSGNAVNIANFKELRKRCEAIGEEYNPSKEALKLESLDNLYTAAFNAQNAANDAESDYGRHVNARQAAFSAVRPFATRVINALACSDAEPGLDRHMRSIVCKIRGTRINPIAKPDPSSDDPNAKLTTHSVSQQSFMRLIGHLQKMLALLNVIPEYQPNEEDLKTTALEAFIAELEATDSATYNSKIALDDARSVRDSLLYAPRTGLVDIALATRRYTRSLGAKHYKSVSSILFRNILKGR